MHMKRMTIKTVRSLKMIGYNLPQHATGNVQLYSSTTVPYDKATGSSITGGGQPYSYSNMCSQTIKQPLILKKLIL